MSADGFSPDIDLRFYMQPARIFDSGLPLFMVKDHTVRHPERLKT